VCGKCREPDYVFKEWGANKPIFICMRCDHEWTCGYDGGVYGDYLGQMIPNPPESVQEMWNLRQ